MQCKPFAPPLAHKVQIPHPYTPAAGTDIRATFARLRGQEQTKPARKARQASAARAAQPDLFQPSAIPAIPAFAAFLTKATA